MIVIWLEDLYGMPAGLYLASSPHEAQQYCSGWSKFGTAMIFPG